jgi:hypothetical protein
MSISFEEAVDSLSSMFPNWERDTLEALLSANDNHVENTIENIFSMEEVQQTPNCTTTATVTQGTTYMDKFEENNNNNNNNQSHFNNNNNNRNNNRSNNRVNGTKSNNESYRDNNNGKRGMKINLPHDFLRPPSFNSGNIIRDNSNSSGPVNSLTIGDEQLALMLQNEIFKHQVESTLGNDFIQGFHSDTSQHMRNNNRQQTSFSNQSRQPPPQSEGIPDMGILKGLSSMGEAAKRSLTQLALQFSNSTSNTTNRDRGSGETRGLVSAYQDGDDDDDESEVINFDTSVNRRGGHTLSDPSPPYKSQAMRPDSTTRKKDA